MPMGKGIYHVGDLREAVLADPAAAAAVVGAIAVVDRLLGRAFIVAVKSVAAHNLGRAVGVGQCVRHSHLSQHDNVLLERNRRTSFNHSQILC